MADLAEWSQQAPHYVRGRYGTCAQNYEPPSTVYVRYDPITRSLTAKSGASEPANRD